MDTLPSHQTTLLTPKPSTCHPTPVMLQLAPIHTSEQMTLGNYKQPCLRQQELGVRGLASPSSDRVQRQLTKTHWQKFPLPVLAVIATLQTCVPHAGS